MSPTGGNHKRMTTARITQSLAPDDEPVRACGMEVRSEMQPQTQVNPYAGRLVWVNTRGCVTPNFQSWQVGNGGGSGRKWYALTPGEPLRSSNGRTFSDEGPTPEGVTRAENRSGIGSRDVDSKQSDGSGDVQSDHLIVARKPVKAGGAKGMTS